ncbi:Histone deacetylase complex subunit [Clarireedia jacksonii]
MDTTRRSSRAARGNQTSQSNSHHSSASSNTSSRAERSTRSNNKAESPRKSTPSASLSSDSPDDATTTEDSSSARRKRGRADDREKASKTQSVEEDVITGADEGGDDDEAVRCICGYEEYPGPPQLREDDHKHNTKDDIEESIITAADVTEDLAGFFLQCDVCKVWQHGGCVGIMNEDTSPDEYFCEQCRKDLHRIRTAQNGWVFLRIYKDTQSIVIRSTRQRRREFVAQVESHKAVCFKTTSRAASFSKDGTRSPKSGKNGRPSSSLQGAKRRSTMNSRDAAYDAAAEAEQIRRAIEASVAENATEGVEGRNRRAKRGRSDSEEKPDGPKRQRTTSASPSPIPDEKLQQTPQQPPSQTESDDGTNFTNGRSGKKIRGAAAKNHREKELREEREKSKLEAANKRKGRAERRRIEDSEPVEEISPAIKPPITKIIEITAQPLDPPPVTQVPVPDATPPVQPPVSHKKGGRPPNARKGKLGKNQYTKDRDLDNSRSPHRSQSRDNPRGDDNNHSTNNKGSTIEPKVSRAKASVGSKVSMAEMKKRVAAILDFISRTQVELAGESILPNGGPAEKLIRGLVEDLPMIKLNGARENDMKRAGSGSGESQKEFKDLSCLEMMDTLTRQLVKWQKEFE